MFNVKFSFFSEGEQPENYGKRKKRDVPFATVDHYDEVSFPKKSLKRLMQEYWSQNSLGECNLRLSLVRLNSTLAYFLLKF